MSDAPAPRLRLGVTEAIEEVVRDARSLGAERVALADALGRVLATDAVSPLSLPPWDNAAMDGVAARAEDVRGATAGSPRALRLVGASSAGRPWDGTLAQGEAVRIATGAAVPRGADAVVRIEDMSIADGVVHVRDDRDARDDPPAAGRRNVRPQGEDVPAGAVAVPAGTRLGPAALGVLASIGARVAEVGRRPRVGIVASGDELLALADFEPARDGARRIVSSNSVSLAALVREAGGEPVDLGVAPDAPDALRDRLEAARESACDVVLTTGAVSVGEHDHVRDAVRAAGGTLRFWRVRIRPGGPLAFGTLPAARPLRDARGAREAPDPDGPRAIPWLGLPGNPVSTVVTFELLARPLLRRLQGDARPFRRAVRATLAEPVTTAAPLTHLLRATLDLDDAGGLVARLTGPQGSGLLTSAARADALVIVPETVRALPAGAAVRVLPLGEGAFDAAALDPATFEPLGAPLGAPLPPG